MNVKRALLALAVCGLPAAGWAQSFSLDGSSQTQAEKRGLQEAADRSGRGAREVFDGQRGGKGGLALAASSVRGLFRDAVAGAAAVRVPAFKPAPFAKIAQALSDMAGKKSCCMDTLETSPDGNIYRMRADHPWWKFWSADKVIEEGVANPDGSLYNKKGEFVGTWQTVMRTQADDYKVVLQKEGGKPTGKDSIYTFQQKGSGTEIAVDGKYVTTLGGSDLREIKIGGDNKVYARYEKGTDDVIVSIDPVTKVQTTVKKVPADYKTWQEWVPEQGYYREIGHYVTEPGTPGYYEWHDGTPGYYDDGGYWHDGDPGYNEWVPGSPDTQVWVVDGNEWVVTNPAHYETHTDRTGVTKFDVDGGGNLYTLKEGQVQDLSGKVVSSDNVQNFAVDGNGTMYTVVGNKLAVNNNEPTQPWSGSTPLNHDDHGNIYGSDGGVPRRYNVTADPKSVQGGVADSSANGPTAGQ